jgi:hypothetical protein
MTGDEASRGESFIENDRVDVLLEIDSDPNLVVQIDRGGMSMPRKWIGSSWLTYTPRLDMCAHVIVRLFESKVKYWAKNKSMRLKYHSIKLKLPIISF